MQPDILPWYKAASLEKKALKLSFGSIIPERSGFNGKVEKEMKARFPKNQGRD